jgi:hypothetical protein
MFERNWNFLDRFSDNIQISNFTKKRQVGAEMFYAERKRTDRQVARQTDRQTDRQTYRQTSG